MEISYELLTNILIQVGCSFALYLLAYRKYVTSIVDPLFTYIYTTAFASILIVQAVQEERFIIHYFICQLFLFLGFKLAQQNLLPKSGTSTPFSFVGRRELAWTINLLFVLYVMANLFTLATRGSALFSADPYARETNYESGFGFFRRINWGIGSFVCAGITILYLTKPRPVYLVAIIIVALFTVLEGTKSSLLRVVTVIVMVAIHPLFKHKREGVEIIKNFAPIGILAVVGVFAIIISKESNDDILISLIRRLLYGADVVMYFYLPQNEYLMNIYKPIDYILYSVNPLLGFLHIAPYVEPFGSVMVSNTKPPHLQSEVYLAPNTPFYIEGQIFFGYYGAFVYSFIVGFIFSGIRRFFLTLSKGSYFMLAFSCTIVLHSINILIETNFFITSCFNTCLFVIPTYILVCLVMQKRIIVHKLKFTHT